MKQKINQLLLIAISGIVLASCNDDDKESVKGISLNTSSMEMRKNTTDTLYATISPSSAENIKVTWVTDNSSVVWIGGGTNEKCVVRAVGPGTANITATTAESGYTATCKIEVYAEIEKMYLSAENIILEKGEQVQLSCRYIPMDAKFAQTVWSSSDTDIVSVDENGIVKALHGGKADVIATSSDGKFSKSCEVTVKVTLTGIVLDLNSLSLVEGETGKLNATLIPEDTTTPDYYWNSSNPSVVSVDENGYLKALKAGTAIITVTTRQKGFSASCQTTVKSAEDVDFKPYEDGQKW